MSYRDDLQTILDNFARDNVKPRVIKAQNEDVLRTWMGTEAPPVGMKIRNIGGLHVEYDAEYSADSICVLP